MYIINMVVAAELLLSYIFEVVEIVLAVHNLEYISNLQLSLPRTHTVHLHAATTLRILRPSG